MSVTHLDHLNLTVRDFEETAAWYGRVFGFEVVERETDAHGRPWGVLRAGDALLCVYEHPEFRFEDSDARRGRGAHGINHFGLRIADRAAWEATMEREGIRPEYGGPVNLNNNIFILFAMMTFIAGLMLLMLGVVSELLIRIYHESQGRLPYKIRRVTRGTSTPA